MVSTIVFSHPSMMRVAADKYPVDILSASIDGVECTVQEGKIVGMRIEKGKTYKISYSVNSTEMFASEVILSAYR